MMDEFARWAPALITLIAAAKIYGGLSKQTEVNTEAITSLQDEQNDQWAHINRSREKIATMQGQLRIHSGDDDLPPAGPRRRTKGASA